MGTLRFEPLLKPLTPLQMQHYRDAVAEAEANYDQYDFFWVLNKGDDPRTERARLLQAAHSLNIPLEVRILRKSRRLRLFIVPSFRQSMKKS